MRGRGGKGWLGRAATIQCHANGYPEATVEYDAGEMARPITMNGQRHYRVIVPHRFGGAYQLECFSEDVRCTRRRLPVIIDMQELVYIKPLAVVGTVMFIDAMLNRGRTVLVGLPAHMGALNYLLEIGFREMMDQIGQWQWPENVPEEAAKGLRPMVRLTRFNTTEEVDRIAEEMSEVFVSEGLAGLLKPCHVVFSELAENVVAHSRASGYVLAQRYEYGPGPVIDIAVGDSGVGLRRALWGNLALRSRLVSDKEALRLAMTDGISGIDDPYRGYGLGHVSAELNGHGTLVSYALW
jgi:hypothetical protein